MSSYGEPTVVGAPVGAPVAAVSPEVQQRYVELKAQCTQDFERMHKDSPWYTKK